MASVNDLAQALACQLDLETKACQEEGRVATLRLKEIERLRKALKEKDDLLSGQKSLAKEKRDEIIRLQQRIRDLEAAALDHVSSDDRVSTIAAEAATKSGTLDFGMPFIDFFLRSWTYSNIFFR